MKILKTYLCSLIIVFLFIQKLTAQVYHSSSPDNKLNLKVEITSDIKWSVDLNGEKVINPSSISMILNQKKLGVNPQLKSVHRNEGNEIIEPVVPYKSNKVQNNYKEITFNFKEYSIDFRVYNDGIAYRFKTKINGQIKVKDENLDINLNPDSQIFFPEEKSFMSHYEPVYLDTLLSALEGNKLCSLPTLLKTNKGSNIFISESGLYDYPNMFVRTTGENSLKADFPKAVIATEPVSNRPDRTEKITENADYIAETSGERNFPWRVFTITASDEELLASNMVYKLARPKQFEDTEWIEPGKVAWDWWNANNIYDVDFRAGINTETYKYYIDFASKLGLDYIILDEGWSRSTTDLTAPTSDIDLQELIAYGKKKDIGIILWMLWKPLNKNMESLLDLFSKWGIKGIKVDFMQRADQQMVQFYERVASQCAKRKLLVDFHGAYKPSGLNRAYPNVLAFEGVKGLENNKWSEFITPDHNLTLPFTRMLAGPMDYTPGAMHNANKKSFRDIFDTPMSMGTRCHQLAMYIVYESGLQMLADSPTHYYREEESAEFISEIPVTWDKTIVLDAKVADYVLVARKHGDNWYVGAMGDWTPRNLDLDLSFLDAGNYSVEIMQDGINADRNANDYKRIKTTKSNKDTIHINLAPGGGWAAIFKK